ncbi:MAG: ArsR family transcriptional regulator, partial [Acidobacteria bacterium]|nr:ArsR family transcriptional regulator [Acidobacteriota bacterium]
TSLRELESWRLVKEVHVLGDRRAHYESLKDVWQMYRLILEERKRREIDPTLAMLRESVAAVEKCGASEGYVRERMTETLEFFETMTAAYEETRHLPVSMLKSFGKVRGKVKKLLSIRPAG